MKLESYEGDQTGSHYIDIRDDSDIPVANITAYKDGSIQIRIGRLGVEKSKYLTVAGLDKGEPRVKLASGSEVWLDMKVPS